MSGKNIFGLSDKTYRGEEVIKKSSVNYIVMTSPMKCNDDESRGESRDMYGK